MAGGGTGDACIMLAQQMVDRRCPGEVVYLDLSTASRAICEARAKARGLRNINFLTGSLLDLPTMPIGQFDYIDCTGVLHHLPDPTAGLQALASCCSPTAASASCSTANTAAPASIRCRSCCARWRRCRWRSNDRIAMAKRLIRFLPTTNLFRRNPYLNDHVTGGDAGLYDLLLHSIDRAFTVPEIGDMAASAGLRVVAFLEPVRYEPATYMSDPVIARQASSLPLLERAAFAERLAGNLRTHVFYATRAGFDTVARPEDTAGDPGAARDGCAEARRRPAARRAADRQSRRLPVARPAAGAGAAHHLPDRRPQDRSPRSTPRWAPRAACRTGRISTPSSRTSTSS